MVYITLILYVKLFSFPFVSTDKAPHFSRLGDEEVNAGQNASFQCVAARRASEAEKFLLEVSMSYWFYKEKLILVLVILTKRKVGFFFLY